MESMPMGGGLLGCGKRFFLELQEVSILMMIILFLLRKSWLGRCLGGVVVFPISFPLLHHASLICNTSIYSLAFFSSSGALPWNLQFGGICVIGICPDSGSGHCC